MMQTILAIDAGGTSTRAAIVDESGSCLGYGAAGSGNPISAGVDAALDAYAVATGRAAERSGHGGTYSCALIAMAGASLGLPFERIAARLEPLGLCGPVRVDSDLLAMFCSGTPAPQGYALAAGTGAVAARITGGELDLVTDGTGWLLGDTGSGYWIGHRIARAVVAELDGLGPDTALTGRLLELLHLDQTAQRLAGRPAVLSTLIEALYALRPVELSRFAPLAFQELSDEVAVQILVEAAGALADTLAATRHPDISGPVVVGGSVLRMLLETPSVADPLIAELGGIQPIAVSDGVVGAAVLALRRSGVRVDEDVFDRISTSLRALRAATLATETRSAAE